MISGIRGRVGIVNFSTALLASTLGMLAICIGAARAAAPRLISYGNFAVSGPFGVGVDNSGLTHSGDIYVAGVNVNEFDGSGKLISPPSPFGSGSGSYSGVAVNPTNGDVYVADAVAEAIDTYDPSTGALIGTPIPVPNCAYVLFGLHRLWVQIASDSTGDVYVPCPPENSVREYSPAGTPLQEFTGSGSGALSKPTGVAIDHSGNVWVADTGNGRVEEFDGSGVAQASIASEAVKAIAVDMNGDLFSLEENATSCGEFKSPCYHVVEYGFDGKALADVGAGSIGASQFGPFGVINTLAVNQETGQVYVTDQGKNVVWIFGPPIKPEIVNELTAEVGTTEAKLGALIKPGGLPTSYVFEYGTTDKYDHRTPFPQGSAGTGVTGRAVWASANGLAADTTYHFRVVVSSELGETFGEDETFTTATIDATRCGNEEFRTGFSGSLPDCRAYEMVTQPNEASVQPDVDSFGGESYFSGGGVRKNYAARNGERFSYIAEEVMPGADSSGEDYLATRGVGGWSSQAVDPLQSYDGDRCTTPAANGNVIRAYSGELTAGVMRVGAGQRYGTAVYTGGCGTEGLEVVPGEPLGVENLLLRDNRTGAYQILNEPPSGAIPTDAHFQGASTELTHVLFTENTPLTENGPKGVEGLYEWNQGASHPERLVSVLPDGTAVAGTLAASWESRPNVISTDGTRVFFTAEGNLYLRIDSDETQQLDKPQGGLGPGGGGVFQGASADGTQAFFTDDASAGLTTDTVTGSGTNLYRYANGQLSDLTATEHAEILNVIGVSKDASFVYFTAQGVLSDAQANAQGQTAQNGQLNLYEWHDGVITFIATANLGDETVAPSNALSPNGEFLVFDSRAPLTGYDNTDLKNGLSDPEIFLYGAADKQLTCASCNPSGEAAANGGSYLDIGGGPAQGAPHNVADDGRVFFQTKEALIPRDTNGQIDVYEYEQGQPQLISSGTSGQQSWLLDTSEEGTNVFFLSHQPLVAGESDSESLVIYDARVGGGFPVDVSPPTCATADACRAPVSPQPPIYGAPPSQTFSGIGNLSPSFSAAKSKASNRARKLARALRACRKQHRHSRKRRLACERHRRRVLGFARRQSAKNARFQMGGK